MAVFINDFEELLGKLDEILIELRELNERTKTWEEQKKPREEEDQQDQKISEKSPTASGVLAGSIHHHYDLWNPVT